MKRTAAVLTLVAVLSAAHDVATAGDAPRAVDVIENDLVADDPAVGIDYRSLALSPVARAMRESILGPISSKSWNEKT